MTAIGAATWDIVCDLFLAFGFSVAVWFCYHIVILAIPPKRLWITIPVHILFFSAAGFLCFCFIVGETTSRQPRWHMALGFALGAWIYFAWFARYIVFCRNTLIRIFKLFNAPLKWLANLLRRQVIRPIKRYLQKKRRIIYNRRMEARAKRAARGKRDGGEEKPKKEPIRAYHES